MNYITFIKVLAELCGAAFLTTLMLFGLRPKFDILKKEKVFIVYWIAGFLLTSILLITIDYIKTGLGHLC